METLSPVEKETGGAANGEGAQRRTGQAEPVSPVHRV